MTEIAATALIAEDEPLLAAALQAELASAWPTLKVLATVGDGASAVRQALALQPDVLFFDVRMPALNGLDAAVELADEWDHDSPGARPFPALVFVTAYDQYAVQAFEAEAVDFVLKPVQAARLQKTVAKLQQMLAARAAASSTPSAAAAQATEAHLQATLDQLRQLMAAAQGPSTAPSADGPLKVIQASVGSSIHMVPVDDVLYFEAADKYVRVLTAAHEYLIRTPLKDLLPGLNTQEFWQIHRSTVVRATAIDTVSRDEAGKLSLTLRGRSDKLSVSRIYAQRFKAM